MVAPVHTPIDVFKIPISASLELPLLTTSLITMSFFERKQIVDDRHELSYQLRDDIVSYVPRTISALALTAIPHYVTQKN